MCTSPPGGVSIIESQEVNGCHDAEEPIHEEEHAGTPSGRLTMAAAGEEGGIELPGRDEVDTSMRLTSLPKSSLDVPPIPSEQANKI